MKSIVFPLKLQMKRPEVGDLQRVLRGLGYEITQREVTEQRFGSATRRAVVAFQESQGLEPTGQVDQHTAELLTREWYWQASAEGGAEAFVVKGVVRQEDGQPLVSGLVRAFDQDRRGEDFLGEASTDQEGSYQITYIEEQFRRSPNEVGGPDLVVRAYTSDGRILATSRRKSNAAQEEVVDLTAEIQSFVMRGKVLQPDGSPESRATVRAFDKDLRIETDLGSATTRADGTYLLRYAQAQLSRKDKFRADLLVRAYDRSGEEIAASPLICSAGDEELVDLVMGNQALRDRSEYEQLVARIRPYLSDTGLADLEGEDVEFLVCSAEVDRLQVATLIVANRLAETTTLPDWLFYALGRRGLRLHLEALLMLRRQSFKDALEGAIEANLVPPPSDEDALDSLLDQLEAALLRETFDGDRPDAGFSFGALLGTSLVDRRVQEAFLARYVARSESLEEFWNGIQEDERFSTEAIDDLRLTLALGRLTRYHLPLLQQLRQLRETGELNSLRDLARLDRARWRELLRASAGEDSFEPPEDIPGETAEDRLEHYITTLRAPIESLFPSDSLRRALTAAPETGPNLARFISNAKDLDLYWMNIDDYLREHQEDALAGIPLSEQDGIIARVKAIQRLLRVSRRSDVVRVLDAAGFDSALAIARTPKRRFRNRFVQAVEEIKDSLDDAYTVTATTTNESGGESRSPMLMMMNSAAPPQGVADSVQESAVSASGFHLQQYVNLHASLQLWPGALGGSEDLQKKLKDDALKEIPDLETLFGSQSFCECEHCRSVYSPAAYLVDLLHELDDLTPTNGNLQYEDPANAPTPIGVLAKCRPDIVHIPLTCENTNTPLPYIDLVNEALESYIESQLDSVGEWTAGTPTIKEHDTGEATADELRAVPQYVIRKVYEHLGRKAVYPMTLPFHRPLEVVRAYLGHLGTSRAEIMEVFRPGSGPSDPALVVERLRMSPAQYQIIAATSSTDPPFDATDGLKDLWAYYGYSNVGELSKLAEVPEMLHRTGLAFADLVGVLKTRFLNPQLFSDQPTNVVQIQFPSSLEEDACDVSEMTLTELGSNGNPAFAQDWLGRLHRFVRLWRVLGWKVADVDRAVAAVGGTLDATALEELAALKEVVDALDHPVGALLGLWAPLDTWGEESPYDRVFLNRAVLQDPEQRKVFEDARSSTSNKKLNDHLSTIAAALGITEDDIRRIRKHAGVGDDALLVLEHLSLLYRYATLAKGLRLRVRDLITLVGLVPASMDPFTSDDPRPTLQFIRTVQSVEASGFTIPLLNYLFVDEAEPTRHPAPTRALVGATLKALQDGLAAIHQETVLTEQPPAEILRAKLEVAAGPQLLNLEIPDDIDRALAILDPRQTTFHGQILTLQDRKDFATAHFGAIPTDLATALFSTPLPGPTTVPDAEERFLENVGTVLDALLPWLRRKLQKTLVVDTMAAALGVDQAIMQLLLERLTGPQQSGTALDFFLGLVDAKGAPTDLHLEEDPPKPPTVMFHRVFKAAAYVSGLGMTAAEVKLFTGTSSPLATFDPSTPLSLDLNELPVQGALPASSTPGQLFDVWRALRAFTELREALPRSEKTLVDYFEATDPSTTPATLEEATGWDLKQVQAVTQGFGASYPPDTLPGLIGLQRAMALLKRVGATPDRIFAWADKTPDHSQADEIVQTVKARYEPARWLEVARGLNDPLREKQRDALVSFLIPRLQGAPFPIETSNDLLEYFLLDVEMDSCMLTSRIKQAISSVQLFVQRCRLNLEPSISPDEIDPDRWEWMKNYRVWEANRKVFLYPENWIEPELRDDKTPFFKELETELFQNELTDETIERAFVDYLYKLDEVGRLDIRAFCKQEQGSQETYHVFGRTWNPPYIFYYRRGIFTTDSGTYEWTPWERVDLDIPGDHVLPTVSNGRLLLFWPLFDQKTDSKISPRSRIRVRLAYAELEHGRWRKKGTSQETIISTQTFDEESDPHAGVFGNKLASSARYMFAVVDGSEPLRVEVGYCGAKGIADYFYVEAARDGVFAINDPGRGGRISAREYGHLFTFRSPLGSELEGQQLARAEGLSVTPFGYSKPVLDSTPAGFLVTVPSPAPVDAETPYSFFLQDGPEGSQTYFARPVLETQGALLDPEVGEAALASGQAVMPEGGWVEKSWGPDTVVELALVAEHVDVGQGATGWVVGGME